MFDGELDQSRSVEADVFVERHVGAPSHKAGSATGDEEGGGNFVRCCASATITAGRVVCASACHIAATTEAAFACEVFASAASMKVDDTDVEAPPFNDRPPRNPPLIFRELVVNEAIVIAHVRITLHRTDFLVIRLSMEAFKCNGNIFMNVRW